MNFHKPCLVALSLVLLAGCSTPRPPAPPAPIASTQAADTLIKSGYDALNLLAKWQHDQRANLRENKELAKALKALKAQLWKAISNTTRRRDDYAEKQNTPELYLVRLQAASEELGKVIQQAREFAK